MTSGIFLVIYKNEEILADTSVEAEMYVNYVEEIMLEEMEYYTEIKELAIELVYDIDLETLSGDIYNNG